MFSNLAQLHCCDAYLRSAAKTLNRQSTSTSSFQQTVGSPRRVLVVEFRDEVFANLKTLLENHGCLVARAMSGAAVASLVKGFAPDLILVYESMPDESGGLITCKVRLTQQHQLVWLYAVQEPQVLTGGKDLPSVDDIIAYGGVLSRLTLLVSQRIERWLIASDFSLVQGEFTQTSSPLLAKSA